MKQLDIGDQIDVLVKSDVCYVFCPKSIQVGLLFHNFQPRESKKANPFQICAKINLKVALIGPCPRQITSDKTSLTGVLNKYQVEFLIDHYINHVAFYDFSLPERGVTNQARELLVQIDTLVTKEHQKIAQK